MDSNLGYAVLNLHTIARDVEQKFGVCEVSKALRKAADKLSEMIADKHNADNK